jgi:hypothetical protein
MAAVRVFVDEAIQGDLPLVCARSGAPADVLVQVRHPVGVGFPPAAWLLVFLGPIGIGILIVVAITWPAQEELVVRIPTAQATLARQRLLRLWRRAAAGAGLALLVPGYFVVGMFPLLWLGSTVALFVVAGALSVMLGRQSVGVGIDVTRRWVSLTNVHPAFAEAVRSEEAAASG